MSTIGIISLVLFGIVSLVYSQWSLLFGIGLILTLMVGYFGGQCLLRSGDGIPDLNVFWKITSASLCNRRVVDETLNATTSTCRACDDEKCYVRNPNCAALSADFAPKVPKSIDDALQKFFETTLEIYVDSWYEKFIGTDDKMFPSQLRISIRYATARLLARINKVDLTTLLLDKVLPAAVHHATVYTNVRQRCNDGNTKTESLEDGVLQVMYARGMLHPAMYSRLEEIGYLRRATEYFIQNCAEKSLSRTGFVFIRELLSTAVLLPVSDTLADPDVVNFLLEVFFSTTPMRSYEDQPLQIVAVLDRFVDEPLIRALPETVFFQMKLSEIIRDPPMLYVFMNYLKNTKAPLNWLQFLLSASTIQEQLHNGRKLTREETSYLHWQSWELYRKYLHEGAPEQLSNDVMPKAVVNEFRRGIEAESDKIAEVIGHALEQAYQIMYQFLQRRYVTSFCMSEQLMEFVCSSRHSDGDVPPSHRQQQQQYLDIPEETASTNDSGTVSSVEGSNSPDSTPYSGSDEEDVIASPVMTTMPKDLNQWRVSVPRIEPRRDPQTGRTMYVYVVEIDVADSDQRWLIDRRYREFYVLESKLVEFHGEGVLGGFPLPTKKTFNNKSRAFIESQRTIFDQFLKRLLHNPALRASELLQVFLTSPIELSTSFFPDPLKAMRKVPARLLRERGQNLSSFLQSLIGSVTKPTPTIKECKSEVNIQEVADISIGFDADLQARLYGTQFKNNYGKASGAKADEVKSTGADNTPIFSNVYDIVIYVVHKFFHISTVAWVTLVALRVVVRNTIESMVRRFVRQQLRVALHEKRLAELIETLREVLFLEKLHVRTEDEKHERCANALSTAKRYFDTELKWFCCLLGPDAMSDGVELLFNCLQYPLLNKQLFYVLLDIVLRELFPELNLEDSTKGDIK